MAKPVKKDPKTDLPFVPNADFEAVLAAVSAKPKKPKQADIQREWATCAADVVYFVRTYCQIYDNEARGWIPFDLWQAQEEALRQMVVCPRFIALKPRQVGWTWLAIAYSLWQMIFHEIAEVLMFSQREDEALALLSDQRLRGMYDRLPPWLRGDSGSANNKSEFRLGNGSGVRALPESAGGDSRTTTLVFIDEADLVTDLKALLDRAEPTVGRSGQIIVIGRADKSRPTSYFKQLYRVAKEGLEGWTALFIPWFAHPGRTKEWYTAQCEKAMRTAGTLDGIYEQYPATDLEALSARTLDKRFPPQWIVMLRADRKMLPLRHDTPTIPGLKLFAYPEDNHRYGIGADPAGGVNDGDDAVCCVVDADSMKQVAVFGGHIEPSTFGEFVADLSAYYLNAPILYELNNHGHAVRAKLKERGAVLKPGMRMRSGASGDSGWLTTAASKATLFNTGAMVMQDMILEAEADAATPEPIIFDFHTADQLASIDINELAAPQGQHDDYAMAWVLAQQCVYRGVVGMTRATHDLWQSPSIPPTPMAREKPAAWEEKDVEAARARLKSRGLEDRR